MIKKVKKKTNRKNYKRRSSSLLYAYPSKVVCDNFTVHPNQGSENSVFIPTLPIKSILTYLKVSKQAYSNDFCIGGVWCKGLEGYYIKFYPENYSSTVDLTKERHNVILKHIASTCGTFVYKGMSYYADFGSLYTYPDFVPIVLNIRILSSNIVVVSKRESDYFIKGFQNILQKGINRYRSIYGKKYPVKLCCVQGIYHSRHGYALKSEHLLRYTKVTNAIPSAHLEQVMYTVYNYGNSVPYYKTRNSDTSSVNYLHELQ